MEKDYNKFINDWEEKRQLGFLHFLLKSYYLNYIKYYLILFLSLSIGFIPIVFFYFREDWEAYFFIIRNTFIALLSAFLTIQPLSCYFSWLNNEKLYKDHLNKIEKL